MDRTKKIWSIVLLCAEILLAVLIVVFTVAIAVALGTAKPQESREAALGWILIFAAIVYALPFIVGFWGSIGFVMSAINIKISPSKVIKGFSIGFCVFYSLILLACAAFIVYYHWTLF